MVIAGAETTDVIVTGGADSVIVMVLAVSQIDQVSVTSAV